MSLFTYSYGRTEGFAAVLDDTNATAIVTASPREIVVLNIRAALPSGGSETQVSLDLYDGTTAYQVVGWIMLQANEIYIDRDPIVVPAGWSLRAIRDAGSDVHVTGLYIEQSGI